MNEEAAGMLLLGVVLPAWLLAGPADWFSHRRTHIEHTSGVKESVLHLAMFVQIGLPLLAALLLEINALVFAFILVMLVIHEATALWDLRYANSRRPVLPFEQHVHSFMEVLPWTATLLVGVLHWPQFLALFGLGTAEPDFALRWKEKPVPAGVLAALLAAAALNGLAYLEELRRCLRAARRG